jgi:2-oxoglutarate dehydrogenase E2 component (dihydrolipoamide succinyltransferase)
MTTKIVVPALGESVVEATVGRWLKHEGEPVGAGEAVVELETDKINLEVSAEKAGVLSHIEHKEGDDVKVGDVLAIVDEAEAARQEDAGRAPSAQATEPANTERPEGDNVRTGAPAPADAEGVSKATSLAQRIAADQGVDIAQVPASGPGKRVTKEDVEHFVSQRAAQKAEGTASQGDATLPADTTLVKGAPETVSTQPLPQVDMRREERQRMSRRRQTIARRLVEAQHTAAMLTTFNEIDMSAVMDIRKRRKESFAEQHGVKLGFMSFFVKASIGALKAYPRLNSEIQGDEIVLKHYYDIGVAIGAEEGLVVPVLRDAERMSFAAIEKAVEAYVQKSRDGSLAIEDLRGGTFTITNGGVFGSLMSTPILNPPQAGILGLHKIEDRPIALKGEVVIRPMMYAALSYDHRIVDGREAVLFLVRIKELIADPESLLLEG